MESIAGRLALQAASAGVSLVRAPPPMPNFEFPREPLPPDAVAGFVAWVKRIFYFLGVTGLLLGSSIATYGVFYLTVMPAHHASEQLFFDYSCNDDFFCQVNEENSCVAHKEQDCVPTATVDLFAKHTPWEAFRPEVLPPPVTQQQRLTTQQPYFIEIALALPESSTNLELGMFGISVELTSSNHTKLARSMRSARLPHESPWVGVVRKLLCLLPLLLGAITESRTLVLSSFRHYTESREYPLQHVSVQLVAPQNSWRSQQPVEVISGELRIGKELNEFQGLLKEWFYTCYFFGSLLIFLVQVLLWACFEVWRGQGSSPQYDNREPDVPPDEEPQPRAYTTEWEGFVQPEFDDDDEWDDLPGDDGAEESTDPQCQEETDRQNESDIIHNPAESGHEAANSDNTTPDLSEVDEDECENLPARGDGQRTSEAQCQEPTDCQTLDGSMSPSGSGGEVQPEASHETANGSVCAATPELASQPTQRPSTKREEDFLAERVMKGRTGRYEIFTDHDDPDHDFLYSQVRQS